MFLCPKCGFRQAIGDAYPTDYELQEMVTHHDLKRKARYPCDVCARRIPPSDAWSCSPCRVRFICSKCVVKTHSGHDKREVSTVLDDFRQRLTKRLDDVTSMKSAEGKIQDMCAATSAVLSQLTTTRAACEKKIASADVARLYMDGKEAEFDNDLRLQCDAMSQLLQTQLHIARQFLREGGQNEAGEEKQRGTGAPAKERRTGR